MNRYAVTAPVTIFVSAPSADEAIARAVDDLNEVVHSGDYAYGLHFRKDEFTVKDVDGVDHG